jgi:hypothetical protein
MKDFHQWAESKGFKLESGAPYRDIANAGQYPPLYYPPVAADAANELEKHPDVKKNTNPRRKKKG